MKRKPLIGVLPQFNYKDEKIFINPPYMNGVIEAGGLPVLLPFVKKKKDVKKLVKNFDGFLFTGGQDIHPVHYNQPLCHCSNEISPERDALELRLFKMLLKANKPVFGICRGLQLINVALGGTLKQDILEEKETGITLQHFQKTPYHVPVHEILIEKNSLLQQILGKDTIFVNSVHHQGIGVLADGLIPMATSVDHLTEAFQIAALDFGIAVQWHPEQLIKSDLNSRKLFSAFVEAAQIKKNRN